MMQILVTEWIKTKRTPIRWLVFFAPVIFAALMIWYFSLRTVTIYTDISIFNAFFEVWTALVIPLEMSLIAGLIIHQEEIAGNFNGFLGSKLPRRNLYLGKLIMLIMLLSVITLLAVLALLLGSGFVLNVPASWPVFILAAIMAVLGTLPLLALYLWTSFAWGMGATISIGAGGMLIAALMATGIGDNIWQYVPWGWPVRLSELVGVYLFYSSGIQCPPEFLSLGYVFSQAIKGLISALIFFVVLVIGGLIWFGKWEGRKIYD